MEAKRYCKKGDQIYTIGRARSQLRNLRALRSSLLVMLLLLHSKSNTVLGTLGTLVATYPNSVRDPEFPLKGGMCIHPLTSLAHKPK